MLDKEVTRAGFGPRAAAYIIDRAILIIALCILRAPFALAGLFGYGLMTEKSFLFDHSALDVICWVLVSAYFVLLTYFGGGTLGKKVMHLRVEKADGAAPGLLDVLYRETVGRFLSGILCLGYLMVLVDKEKRGFHDYLCDTRVVYGDVTFRTKQEAARTTVDPAASYSLPGESPAPEADIAPPAEEPVPAPEAWTELPYSGYSTPGESGGEEE